MSLNFKLRPTLVAYVTCGDPDLATTREIVLAAIDAGAQVVELGVPFSDPVADGPVIQRASERALKHGTTVAQVLELARDVRKQRPQAGLIVFSYLNPVLRMGLGRFCAAAADAGVDGALITDLTVDEAGDYLRAMRSRINRGYGEVTRSRKIRITAGDIRDQRRLRVEVERHLRLCQRNR